MSRSTIGGQLNPVALARLYFNRLSRDEQLAAMRRMKLCGHSEYTIAEATGLTVVFVRKALNAAQEATPP
jgi:hypothetical protein